MNVCLWEGVRKQDREENQILEGKILKEGIITGSMTDHNLGTILEDQDHRIIEDFLGNGHNLDQDMVVIQEVN